jgi:ligand-binding sensor domain-containing protein/signal transduction histidine kinase/DNA-binding response OmpR family regulator
MYPRTMKLHYNLIFFLLFPWAAAGQDQKPVLFSCLTTDNGLSESHVNCMIKDKYGFMWFGTQDGLNKYDGYKFRVFRNKPGDSATIPNNNINCLFEDKTGELWIGTADGIVKYNRNNDSFTRYGGAVIHSICESTDGNLWIGTFSGLIIMDRKTGKIMPVSAKYKALSSIENYETWSVHEDNHGNLWAGTFNGIFLFNLKSSRIRNIVYYPKPSDPEKRIAKIEEDDNGRFWVATGNGLYVFKYVNDTLITQVDDIAIPLTLSNSLINSININKDQTIWAGKRDGLVLFNPANGTYKNFKKNPLDDQSISHNYITALYFDDQDILWIGTFGGGITKYDKKQPAISRYRIFSAENPELTPNNVTSFQEDREGNIWIGTEGGGMYLWEAGENRFMPFYPGSVKNNFPSYSVTSIKLSRNGKFLWFGTADKGLIELNVRTGAMQTFNAENGRLKNNHVVALLEDRQGRLWVATDKGGISILDKTESSHILPNSSHRSLFEDAGGNIWIGNYYGIHIFTPDKQNFSSYTPGNSNINAIINCIFKDSEGNIWIGTMQGLQLLDRRTRKFTNFSEKEGLANNIVNSIVEARDGCLWIGTARGMSRFDRKKHVFRNYTKEDGLPSNEFSREAGYVTRGGKILFGTLDGFTGFFPEDITVNADIPAIAITDFQVFNKSVPTGKYNHQLKYEDNKYSEITLSYDQSGFSMEFAALSYTVPEKNQYAYMLEGFDKDWNYPGHEHKAVYTNLDPGEYVFKVIASNNDDVWNKEGTSLKILISPPFWKTKLAYLIYLLLLVFILYYIYREIKARERLKNEIVFQKLTAEKIEELNRMKLNFFTNISHELRTPLSLIIDPLRKIISEKVSAVQTKALSELAFKNASRLSKLVSQLLDFRRFSGQHKLETSHVNLVEIIGEICQVFEEKARERKIEFRLSFNVAFSEAWIDTDKLEKILTNLISNAFKFTPDKGKILLIASTIIEKEENKYLIVQVKDTGPGIPQAYKEKIFDLFFQVEETPRYDMESSGIGLSLAKELVLLQGGEISEEGKEGKGAVFIVKLPVKEYIPQSGETEASAIETEKNIIPVISESEDSHAEEKRQEIPVILLVEDNPELRKYIEGEVLAKYHVEQATSGTEGFEKAVSLIPDLVISDIMMPGGNGLELCEKLKEDEKTSHIPVILLTARQTDENKIEGYRKGADAYVSKPFNSVLLNAQVENLLESRKKLRTLFSSVETSHPAEAQLADIDKEFLKKAEEVIIENLSAEEFDVEALAEMMKMNRIQLTRKLKALSDQMPGEYIMIVRLKKAVELLLEGKMNVSQVSYQVGFSEPANFIRSFRKIYGKSPKKYVTDRLNRRA